MKGASPILMLCVMATVFCALAAVPVFLAVRSSERAKRVLQVIKAPLRLQEEKPATVGNPFRRILLRAVHFVRTRLGFEQDEKLRQKLLSAGLRDSAAVDTYFAIRLIGPVLAVVAGTFMPQNTVFWIIALMGLAYLAPDAWVQHRARVRREHIRLGLPDALDLMVVCVDAGLGIDQALLRAGQELALSQPEISQEFNQINFEQRAGKPRIDAWQSMAERTELDTVKSFVHMLAQTDRFGTPLVRALRVFADGVRQKAATAVRGGDGPTAQPHLAAQSLRYIAPFCTALGAFVVLNYADVLVAYFTLSGSELGAYAASAVLPKAIVTATQPVSQVILPVATHVRGQNLKTREVLLKAIGMTFALAALGASALWLLSGEVCGSHYGIKFCNPSIMALLASAAIAVAVIRPAIIADLLGVRHWRPHLSIAALLLFAAAIWFERLSGPALAMRYMIVCWLLLCTMVALKFLDWRRAGDGPFLNRTVKWKRH